MIGSGSEKVLFGTVLDGGGLRNRRIATGKPSRLG